MDYLIVHIEKELAMRIGKGQKVHLTTTVNKTSNVVSCNEYCVYHIVTTCIH